MAHDCGPNENQAMAEGDISNVAPWIIGKCCIWSFTHAAGWQLLVHDLRSSDGVRIVRQRLDSLAHRTCRLIYCICHKIPITSRNFGTGTPLAELVWGYITWLIIGLSVGLAVEQWWRRRRAKGWANRYDYSNKRHKHRICSSM